MGYIFSGPVCDFIKACEREGFRISVDSPPDQAPISQGVQLSVADPSQKNHSLAHLTLSISALLLMVTSVAREAIRGVVLAATGIFSFNYHRIKAGLGELIYMPVNIVVMACLSLVTLASPFQAFRLAIATARYSCNSTRLVKDEPVAAFPRVTFYKTSPSAGLIELPKNEGHPLLEGISEFLERVAAVPSTLISGASQVGLGLLGGDADIILEGLVSSCCCSCIPFFLNQRDIRKNLGYKVDGDGIQLASPILQKASIPGTP